MKLRVLNRLAVLAMLAAGHKQVEVADHLGVTPSAVCQRRTKAAREWAVFQGEEPEEGSGEWDGNAATSGCSSGSG